MMSNKISYESRCKVYEAAIEKWGVITQLYVAIEEMSEVTKALTKWLRAPYVDWTPNDSIVEEVADAAIMLEQLRYIFGINEEVCEVMDAKIERLKARVSE